MEGWRGRQRQSRWRVKKKSLHGKKVTCVMTSCVIIFFQQRRVIRARKCMNDGQWVTWVSVSTVSASLVSSLPVADRVVLLSSEEDKAALTPSVCAPPLSGLCWFNPGGQQPGLTAPRHRHVIYGPALRAQSRWPLRFNPCRLISHSSRGRQHSDWWSFTHPRAKESLSKVSQSSWPR